VACIHYEGRAFESKGNSVLDCLLEQGYSVPNACRAGVCQSCLMLARSGDVPARAQAGLSAAMRIRNLFLACQCFPEQDLDVASTDAALVIGAARVRSIARLAEDIAQVRLEPSNPFNYRAGQFLRLYLDGQTGRNYSLASVPGLDDFLELHVRRVAGGRVSGWVFDTLEPGDTVTISEASGNCYYATDRPEQDLLLLATGTGLAPLMGIAREALHNGHSGQIRLYHGNRTGHGAYLAGALRALAANHSRFTYQACVSEALPGPGEVHGRPPEVALRDIPDLTNWRVYLCGSPRMVEAGRIAVFLAGAASAEIFADPFLPYYALPLHIGHPGNAASVPDSDHDPQGGAPSPGK